MALAAAVKALWPLSGKEDPGFNDTPNVQKDTDYERLAYNDKVATLRQKEYPQLKDVVYLDHAGTAIPSKSLIDEFSQCLLSNLVANPHSASSTSSQFSSRKVDDVRVRALEFFKANPDDFDLVFTANATAAIKLVGECIRDAAEAENRQCKYNYHKDAHTSLIGLREMLSKGDGARCFETDLEVDQYLNIIQQPSDTEEPNVQASPIELFAYPAQSNMDGRRLPYSWIGKARSRGLYTLLDAAALVSTEPLDLSDLASAPDFTVLSFYKIFGFPDLGALIIRKDASELVQKRRYFGGGTVEMVSCLKEQWMLRKQGSLHEQLEDGTLPVHSIVALDCALSAHTKLYGSMQHVADHTRFLADRLFCGLTSLEHPNQRPACKIYGDRTSETHGPVIAFNILGPRGEWESNHEIEKLAAVRGIQLRTGGVCNPGGIASALNLGPWEMQANFSAGYRCGGEDDIHAGKPTGVVRVSLGASSTIEDVDAFITFIRDFFVREEEIPVVETCADSASYGTFHIESLTVYPIKSCAGWNIPPDSKWAVQREGLAWDREWCLVHAGTRAALSQKKLPRMALIRPRIDLESGLLRISYQGPLPAGMPSEVTIPLSANPTVYKPESQASQSTVCGDQVSMRTYASDTINDFFSSILDTPCSLARFPKSETGKSARHAKAHLAQSVDGPRPLMLSNESPILVVSRSSLNRLNESIKSRHPPGRAVAASVFRANIVIAEELSGSEQPYIEDDWKSMAIVTKDGTGVSASLDVLGPCRRCQMVCIDQATGNKSTGGEPFVSLSKTRRWHGKVWFGVHAALATPGAMIQVGDRIEARHRET